MRSAPLILPILFLSASCALFGVNPDADDGGDGDGDGDSGYDSGGDSGGDWSCYGAAYKRTDDPGTAICMDGSDTFECAWGSGNPSVDGFRVEGNHDAANDLLTLYFPDNPEASSFTPFTFDVLFGYDGNDMVLEYMGSRSGDYQYTGSWNEAVAGDNGVCGGDGSEPQSETCTDYCSTSADCGPGEACLNAMDGMKCLPTSCQGCWDAGYSCSYFATTCEFSQCS